MSLQAGKAEVVEQIGESLLAAGMTDVLPLPKARIPVVKFIIGKTATKVCSSSMQFRL